MSLYCSTNSDDVESDLTERSRAWSEYFRFEYFAFIWESNDETIVN